MRHATGGNRRAFFLTATALLLGAPAARAETATTMPDTVVTATRVPTAVTDIPAGVTVIDRADIEARGYDTLVDALWTMPGVRASPSGGPGGQASLFVRGTNSNHVLVLRDGMPINDSSEVSDAFNFGVDTLADIERIEVIRGPMAALYGSGAIGGVINLISRRGTEPGFHITGDLGAGYPAQVRSSVSATGVAGAFDYALTAEAQFRRGFDATPQRERVYTGTPQGFRDRYVTLNLGYTVVPGTRLSLFLRAREALFGFNELGNPTFDAANANGHDTSLLGRVGIDSRLFDGTWQTSLYLGHLRDDRHYLEALNPFDPNQNSVDERFHGRRTDLQWNNTVHLGDHIHMQPISLADVTFGYQHTADAIDQSTNDSFGGFPFAQTAHASMHDDAAYLGLQTQLWQRLTITGQVRQDWVAENAPTTWRIGGVYDIPAIATHVKASYGTAFRAPSLFERFGVDSFGYVGNPNLRPEHARGWEIGFTTTLPAAGRADFVTFGATYFNEHVRDLIVGVFSPVDTEINAGAAHMQGVETEIAIRPWPWLRLQTTWTFTEAVNADTGATLLRRPRHSASVTATITPRPQLSFTTELSYTGGFQDFLTDDNGFSTGTTGTSPHGMLLNLTATYDVTPRVQLYANGRNVLNSRFEPVNGFQVPGASFLIGARMSL